MRSLLIIVTLFLTSALLASEASNDATAQNVALGDQRVTLSVNGTLRTGRLVVPGSKTDFRLKLDGAGGGIVTYAWDQVDEIDRHRVQHLLGMDTEARGGFGKTVTGTRFTLQDSRYVEGLRQERQDKPGFKAIKTGTMPLVLIPEALIVSEENVERPQSAFYTGTEIYEQWIFENPPGPKDAAAHLAMARRCAAAGLYDKARLHLDCAAVIDPRTVEPNVPLRREVVRNETEEQAMGLYLQLLSQQRGGDFFGALDTLDTLKRCFPNSELKSRWEPLRVDLESAKEDEQARRIVSMSYAVADHLIRRKVTTHIQVDEKGNPVPARPGKVVITQQGDVLKGVLDPTTAVSADMLVLKDGEHTISIAKKDILKIRDEDLSIGVREADPALEDLQAWVRDVRGPDGLKMTMINRLAELTGLPSSRVKQLFDARLVVGSVYENGAMKRSVSYAAPHDVKYGIASWLREGAKVAPLPEWEQNELSAKTRDKGPTHNGYVGEFKPAAPGSDVEAQKISKSDDPAIWWSVQNIETRFSYVKSFAAEKVFVVTDVQKPACKYCGGRGFVQIIDSSTEKREMRCLCCKGMSAEFKITYH
jgi:hypothetical protein